MLSLSGTIEEGIGVIVLSVCLALIPFYSLGMQYILNHDDDSRSVKHVIGSTVYVVILIAAAETNSRVILNCFLLPHKAYSVHFKINWRL